MKKDQSRGTDPFGLSCYYATTVTLVARILLLF